jgi:parallel beta-helix repeat protein
MRNIPLKFIAFGLACVFVSLATPYNGYAEDAAAKPETKLVVPTNGMKITEDTTLAPGTYVLDKGIEIAADGVTLDGKGAVLIGTDFKNAAVSATGRKNITVKNVTAERYYFGIKLQDCKDVTVDANNITKTAEAPALYTWTDIMIPAENAYGAGIILIKVTGGKVSNNYLEHQQNGLSLYSCSGVTAEKNDTSYASGWGIHLNDSSDNIVQNNLADFCNRVNFRGGDFDYVGADAAGLLMVNSSCRNKILQNYFRAGGDGIFMTGGKNGCNDNLLEQNDCSLSPNNAIEAWGTQGNTFRKNKCNKSNYGFWLGGASKCQIVENQVMYNRFSGVTVDHGNSNTITKNIIKGNEQGIMLWSNDPNPDKKDTPEPGDSFGYIITDNVFTSNRVGIYVMTTGKGKAKCYNMTVTGNKITDSQVGIVFERTNDSKIEDNTMCSNTKEDVRQVDCTGNSVKNNTVLPKPKGNLESRVVPREVPVPERW